MKSITSDLEQSNERLDIESIRKQQELIVIQEDFMLSLRARIVKLRHSFKVDDKKHFKGSLFRNTIDLEEAILTAVLDSYHLDGDLKKEDRELRNSAYGLILNKKSVRLGHFDVVINLILGRVAEIDFEKETSIDFQ